VIMVSRPDAVTKTMSHALESVTVVAGLPTPRRREDQAVQAAEPAP
jgi:hypothetical protein